MWIEYTEMRWHRRSALSGKKMAEPKKKPHMQHRVRLRRMLPPLLPKPGYPREKRLWPGSSKMKSQGHLRNRSYRYDPGSGAAIARPAPGGRVASPVAAFGNRCLPGLIRFLSLTRSKKAAPQIPFLTDTLANLADRAETWAAPGNPSAASGSCSSQSASTQSIRKSSAKGADSVSFIMSNRKTR